MTVADSSAFMAILLQEPDADRFARALTDSPSISAATLVELGAVCMRRGGVALLEQMQVLVHEASVVVVPLTTDVGRTAIDGYRRYGLGIGKPACLNFGDCFSYALAKALDEPLLYKGDDFARTDVRSAL
jgi:ribonuclease VapC